ncbi:unnamed protein product, partial [Ectocarpus sp. 12 AP-2014]
FLLLSQRLLKNVFPSPYILPISLAAFSTHFLRPSTVVVFSSLFDASHISLYLPSTFPSSVMYAKGGAGVFMRTVGDERVNEHTGNRSTFGSEQNQPQPQSSSNKSG